MKVLVVAVLACLLAIVNGQCSFATNNANGYHGTDMPTWKTCVSSVVYNSTIRTAMDSAMAAWKDLYSFTDYSSSDSTFNISVSVTPLALLGSYSDMSAYFQDILVKTNRFRDAHFAFDMPNPYAQSFVLTPFCLTSTIDGNGQQVLKTLGYFNGAPMGSAFDSVAPTSNAASFVNKTLAYIDGVPAMTFFRNWLDADDFGLYRDRSARFNAALGRAGRWCGRPLQNYPYVNIPNSHTYNFTDGTSVTISNKVFTPTVANSAAFSSQIYNSQQATRDLSKSFRSLGSMQVSPVERMYATTPDYFPEDERQAQAHYLALRRIPPAYQHTEYAKMHGYDQTTAAAAKRGLYPNSTITNQFVWVGGDGGVGIAGWKLFNPTPVGVLRVNDFAALPGFTSGYTTPFGNALKQMALLNLTNLIIDLTGNSGGLTSLSYNLLMWMSPEWEQGNFSKASVAIPPSSFRITNTTDSIYNSGNMPDFMTSRITGQTESAQSFYVDNKRTNVPRGSLFSTMTSVAYLNASADLDGGFYSQWGGNTGAAPLSAPFYFDKIIVLTDGLCASACAQFLKQLRVHDRARVIFVGGLAGDSSDIASFPGGAKFGYNAFSASTIPLPFVPFGGLSFNWVETYSDCNGSVPLDFLKIPADAQYLGWDVVSNNVVSNNADGRDNSIALYQWAAQYFDQMPIGLPKINRNRAANATDFCSSTGPLIATPAPFSQNCYGVWEDQQPCSQQCDGGFKLQKYNLIIKGLNNGTACPATHGQVQNVTCNTEACVACVGSWVDHGVCRAECKKERIYKVKTGQCPFANNTISDFDCNNNFCQPQAPAGKRGAIVPFLHCVDQGGPNVMYFGYYNQNNKSIFVPPNGNLDDSSTNNIFLPGAKNRGQPTTFLAGFQPFAFSLNFTETSSLWWTLDQRNQTFSGSLSVFKCPDTSTLKIRVEGTTAPSQSQLNQMLTLVTSDTGLDTGRLTGNITLNPTGYDNMYQIHLTIASAVGVAVSNARAFEIIADLIREEPANYFLTLGTRINPTFDFGNVSIDVDWAGTTIQAPSAGLPALSFIDDDQLAPVPAPVNPPPTPIEPPSSAPHTAISMVLTVVFVLLAIALF